LESDLHVSDVLKAKRSLCFELSIRCAVDCFADMWIKLRTVSWSCDLRLGAYCMPGGFIDLGIALRTYPAKQYAMVDLERIMRDMSVRILVNIGLTWSVLNAKTSVWFEWTWSVSLDIPCLLCGYILLSKPVYSRNLVSRCIADLMYWMWIPCLLQRHIRPWPLLG